MADKRVLGLDPDDARVFLTLVGVYLLIAVIGVCLYLWPSWAGWPRS